MRINRFIAQSGYCSRRKADILIKNSSVAVNGQILLDFSYIVTKDDRITIDGKHINHTTKFEYIVLRKPKRYVSTVFDDRNRPTVIDLVKSRERIYPIGRLDYHSSGVLLLTNDGDFAHYLSHPSSSIKKIYDVEVKQYLSKFDVKKLQNGVEIEGKITAPCRIDILEQSSWHTVLRFVLHEGRNRQIRKMLKTVAATVQKLDRISYGGITYKTLKSGEYRFLKKSEIQYLKSAMRAK